MRQTQGWLIMVNSQVGLEQLGIDEIQRLLDAMPAPFLLISADLILVAFNRAAVRMAVETTGTVPRRGELADRFLPDGFRLKDNALTRDVLGGETATLGLDTRTAAGIERSFEISVWPAITDNGGVRLFGVLFSEVSGYKDAQERMRRAESAMRLMIASAPCILLALNAEGTVRFAGGGGLAAAGLTATDLTGHNLLTGTPRLEGATQLETDHYLASLVIDTFTFEVYYNAVRRENGTISGYVAAAVDVSARAEEGRRRLIERKHESLVRLARGLAHDFGNILTVFVGNASMLRETNDMETARELADEIVEASWRTNTVIRQLLAFSEGTAVDEVRLLDLNSLSEEAVRLIRNFTPQGLSLHLQLDRRLPPVQGEAALLRELAAILLSNAVDAAGPAGVIRLRTLTAPTLERGGNSLLVPAELPPRPWACLAVEDNGPGIDADMLDSVFDPYFTTRFPGRGLGLANAYGIVLAHGGAIHVTTEAGVGTTFTIILPGAE